jgi:hypothetical protein
MDPINGMEMYTFLTIMVMTLGMFLFVAGIFTAYFGSGKSRKIGIGLTLGGIIIAMIWALLVTPTGAMLLGANEAAWGDTDATPILNVDDEPIGLINIVIQAAIVIIAAAVGAAIAIGAFLGAIMKA